MKLKYYLMRLGVLLLGTWQTFGIWSYVSPDSPILYLVCTITILEYIGVNLYTYLANQHEIEKEDKWKKELFQ